jgi:hypothetical protein
MSHDEAATSRTSGLFTHMKMLLATADDKAKRIRPNTTCTHGRESCSFKYLVAKGNAKEASVLVRLKCRSGFNVGGLECMIITESAHGPWSLGCLY